MSNPKCDVCGGKTKKNGTTSSGRTRFRCNSCGASFVRKIDNEAKGLASFISFLLSKKTASELSVSRTTFWRRTAKFWRLWPIAVMTGEAFDVIYLDGIWFGHKAVVLIAYGDNKVPIKWHLARSECTASWAALIAGIPAPKMAVIDGGTGVAKAICTIWPGCQIQRCTFHAAEQVKRYTTRHPKLECGRELLGLAIRLERIKGADEAAGWLSDYSCWHSDWDGFLKEYTLKDGKRTYVHERLRKARRSLDKLIKDGTLFTFITMGQEAGGAWPATNNAIESLNARIRELIYRHRGMPLLHRVKAVFWYLYMRTEDPMSPAQMLSSFPDDDHIDGLFALAASKKANRDGGPEEYGTGIDWNEFHMPTQFRR